MKLNYVLLSVITTILVGCGSTPADELEKLYEQQEKARALEFSGKGNCLVLHEFTNLSILKNVGYDSKYLNNRLVSAYYDDGKIIIQYANDSLVFDPSSEEIAVSSLKRIAVKLNDKNDIGVGYVSNNSNSCVKNRSSTFITTDEIQRLSALQPN